MSPSNAARDVFSEEARREANSFLQQRKESAGPASTSAYVSRIHGLVIALGLIILVLGGTLVYLVNRPPEKMVLPAIPAAVETAKAPETVQIVVAKLPILEGEQLTPEKLATQELDRSLVPEGAFNASQASVLTSQYAATEIKPGVPIVAKAVSITKTQPMPFEIPAGSRAVTIPIDGRTGVEGFAKPGTFVDVLWFYNDSRGRQRVVTIVHEAKVLSVGGTTDTDQKAAVKNATTATLLVTRKQAHVIELARNLGSLSLSLVGEKDGKAGSGEDEEVTVADVLRAGDQSPKSPVDGVAIAVNPVTGQQEKFVLKKKDWVDGETDTTELERMRYRRRVRAVNGSAGYR